MLSFDKHQQSINREDRIAGRQSRIAAHIHQLNHHGVQSARDNSNDRQINIDNNNNYTNKNTDNSISSHQSNATIQCSKSTESIQSAITNNKQQLHQHIAKYVIQLIML